MLNFKKNYAKSQKDTAWINSCKIISKNPIVHQPFNYQNKIIRKNLIKVKEDPSVELKKPGDQILCLCNFKKYNEDFLEMHLTLGNKIIDASY